MFAPDGEQADIAGPTEPIISDCRRRDSFYRRSIVKSRIVLGIAVMAAIGFGFGQLLPASAAPSALATLSVVNNLNTVRVDEVLDLPLADVLAHAAGATPDTLVVRDASSGVDLETQLIDEDNTGAPDHLLVLLNIGGGETRTLQVFSIANEPPFPSRVFARFAPERKDDFAWESDKIAFRAYGPALQATGEISCGVDVWSKRVPRMILNEWYAREDEGAQFKAEGVHDDHGTGLDCYKVGPTLGCGGVAGWDGAKLLYSKNYVTYKIIANGPIRAMFELTYAPWNVNGVQVSEVKRVSLDAGSHMNKMQPSFTFSGADSINVASGLIVHIGGDLKVSADHTYMTIWEPGDVPATNTHNATAMVAAPGDDQPEYKEAQGHGLYLFKATSGKPITYYSGAGWSNYDIESEAAWQAYVADFAARLASPLKVEWK
jgi:pectinesterase